MSNNDNLKQTISQMITRVLNQKEDWSKHLAHTCCKCQKCTCGKHLCKFQSPKIQLKPTETIYKQSYKKKQSHVGGRSLSQKKLDYQGEVYHPRQFIQKSEYCQEYYRKKATNGKNARAQKKQDTIKLGGPAFTQTTYQKSYLSKYIPPPQKIKNPQNLANPTSRMNTTSNYRNNYGWNTRKPIQKEQPIKRSDNIKVGNIPFVGQSNYGHDYHKYKDVSKNRDSFAPHQTYNPVQGMRPKSSYRCDYTGNRVQKCPAEKCC